MVVVPVQFKMVSMRSEKPICAPPHLSDVSTLTLPLKQFHCSSEGLIIMVGSRHYTRFILFVTFCSCSNLKEAVIYPLRSVVSALLVMLAVGLSVSQPADV